jgi:hypothetical protein
VINETGMKKGENMVMARMGRTAKVIKEAKGFEGKRRRRDAEAIIIYRNKSSFMRHLRTSKKSRGGIGGDALEQMRQLENNY